MSIIGKRGTTRQCSAALAAERLRIGLERCDVSADVHEGHGVALVSVWTDLLIWTDGLAYRWWTGKISEKTDRRLYRAYGVDKLVTVPRCVAQRYEEFRKVSDRSECVAKCTL